MSKFVEKKEVNVMTDFICFVFSTAMLYFFSLLPLEYAKDKSKKTCAVIVCLVIAGFSILNGWAMNINLNKIPMDSVEKSWEEYVTYCKEEQISWNELTFPEWLGVKASE